VVVLQVALLDEVVRHAPLKEQPHRFAGRPAPSQTRPAPDPWAAQLLAHEPQLPSLAETGFSQPSSGPGAAGRAQLSNPSLHVDAQAPAEHWSDATPAVLQARPQAPQWVTLLPRSASHPFDGTPSQSSKLPVQAATSHTPPRHTGLAFGKLHAAPHLPQLATPLLVSTSQPLSGLPSQSAKPPLHCATVHLPAAHPAVALGRLQTVAQPPQWIGSVPRSRHAPPQSLAGGEQPPAHTPALQTWLPAQDAPHLLQFFGSDCRLVSQPFAWPRSQLAKPGAQDSITHVPTSQIGVACGSEQAFPQAPQLPRLVASLASQPFAGSPSQSAKPSLQAAIPQTPAAQFGVALGRLHAAPQAPQFAMLVLVFTSQPSDATPLQSPVPALQVAMMHAPPTHPGVAFARAQALPQALQLAGLVLVFTSQPSLALRLQSVNPTAQNAIVQAPALQTETAAARLQATPQPPQLDRLVWRLTSQPSDATPLQSANPALQPAIEQSPPAHPAMAFGREQAPVQLPQWFGSVASVTQEPPQFVVPPVQFAVQEPPLHTCPPVQATPHFPQLLASVSALISQPSDATPLQSRNPALQLAIVHWPAAQPAVALAKLQT
jgi:hypothetical protein